MTPRRAPVVSAVVGSVLLFAAACGGDSSTPSASPTITASPVATSVTPGASPTGAIAGSCPSTIPLKGNVNDHGSVVASGSELSIEAGDFFFAPTCATEVSAGSVTLVVRNTGQALHNVSIPEQGIDQDVEAGKTIEVVLNVAEPLVFVCKYHRTSGMVGGLVPAGS